MLSIQILLNLRRVALHNAQYQDSADIFIEKAYRYVSHHYNSDLFALKNNIDPATVVLIFMEDQLLDLQKEDLDDIQQILNATPMPILSGDGAVIESVMSDEVWLAEQAKIAKKMEDDRKKKEQIDTENKTHEAIDALRKTFSNSNIKEGGE